MRTANTDLIINRRHYTIQKIDRFNVAEGWGFYQVFDAQTKIQFHVSEFIGEKAVLEDAQRKAEELSRLKIQGIPLIYEAYFEDGRLFVVTDNIQGCTLKEYLALRGGPAKDDLVAMVEYGRRICAILSRLHPTFIHRGLRPENIAVIGDRVLLTDLGFLFMPIGFERQQLIYRAPEQTTKGCGDIGYWTDIYEFGVIFGEMLTGNCCPLFDETVKGWGENPETSNHWHQVPGELKKIVIHCTQNLSSRRPKSIEEVKRKLSEWLLFRKGEQMANSSSTQYSSVANSCTFSSQLNPPRPIISQDGGECPTCSGSPGDKNKCGFDHATDSGSTREMTVPQSWLPRLGSFLSSARKRGNWMLLLLILLLPTIWMGLYPLKRPAAAIIPQTAVVEPASNVQSQELFNKLSGKLLEFESLALAYKNAKVPGSPEKTAQNFRNVERKAAELSRNISDINVVDKDLTEVISMEIKMFDTLKSAAEFFAGYLEGERKLTNHVDWVEEADAHYRMALDIQAQVAMKLDELQSKKDSSK